MNFKGAPNNINNFETPEDVNVSKKHLDSKKTKSQRVDINVLRSKLENQESKEFKKNLTIFVFCIFLLGAIGVYLSL
tara:strand:+ start:321 stop:551 length:231 start_codon:yes stop_codon:yes gene_type:complete